MKKFDRNVVFTMEFSSLYSIYTPACLNSINIPIIIQRFIILFCKIITINYVLSLIIKILLSVRLCTGGHRKSRDLAPKAAASLGH